MTTQRIFYNVRYVDPGGRQESFEWNLSVNKGGYLAISESIVGPVTDKLVACILDVDQIKSVIMWCNADIRVETNNATSPIDTFLLLANVPVIWESNIVGATNPFTADVTALYVTNSQSDTRIFNLRAIYDVTV